jgi:hypothetical protein
MLALSHDPSCSAVAALTDVVDIGDIRAKRMLKKKFNHKSPGVSKFYGCYTKSFAEEWSKTFGVPAAGAKEKVDFGVVDRKSDISNVMERIEKTPTSKGPPGWKQFGTAHP